MAYQAQRSAGALPEENLAPPLAVLALLPLLVGAATRSGGPITGSTPADQAQGGGQRAHGSVVPLCSAAPRRLGDSALPVVRFPSRSSTLPRAGPGWLLRLLVSCWMFDYCCGVA